MIINSLERRPQTIQFETHNYCNASCEFCCHAIMKRKKGKMDNELIENILLQANETDTIIPFLMGEPFLDSRIIDVLKKCRQIKPSSTIVIHSNMSNISKSHIQDIIENDLIDELHISFYGIDEQQYLKLQGLDYYTVIENIITFVNERNIRDKKKPRIICDYIMMDELMPYLKKYESFWGKIVDNVRTVFYDDWHGDQVDRGLQYHPVQVQRVPCYKLWQSLNVHWNGNVPICCMDYNGEVIIGDLNNETINEVWHGNKLKIIRDKHLNGDYESIPICKNCKSWRANNPPWWNTMWEIVLEE